MRGLSDGFIENGDVPTRSARQRLRQPRGRLEALQTRDDVAIIDGFTIQSGFGPSEFALDGVPSGKGPYDAPTILIRDAASGASRAVEVIGIIAFGASSNFTGVYVGEKTFVDVFGEPEVSIHYVAVTDPDNADQVANQIEAALVTSGAQADSLKK